MQNTLSSRAAIGLPAVQPLGRVRRASQGILHTINNEHQQDEEILTINETHIPEVSSTKFLSVSIDKRLSWIPHINYLHTT